jgi:hypothetical protein
MIFRLAAILLFLLPSLAPADHPQWFLDAIKKDNPNELAYNLYVFDCPFTYARGKEIVEGVFVRSRVKPTENTLEDPIYLAIGLSCFSFPNNTSAFSLNVHFGAVRGDEMMMILFDKPFGWFGVEANDEIQQSLKESVESAITAYLQANFDL